MKKIKSIISLLLVIAVLIFAVQNAAAVQIQFLFWGFSIPRALLIVGLMSIGFVLGMLVASLARFKR